MTLEIAKRALEQIACEHKNTIGGNDYMYCDDCGLEWNYAKRPRPTMEQIATLVLEQNRLFNCNDN